LNAGSPLGFGELSENRHKGMRQLASSAYSLKGVQLMTETLVKRVLVEENNGRKVATGVELADGKTISAKEVIVSAGAYRTPQVLLLSGIGPAAELAKHGIEQTVDSPEVGKNLHDHLAVSQWCHLPPSHHIIPSSHK
jgi:choline dehydrogenase-like flavoprotein